MKKILMLMTTVLGSFMMHAQNVDEAKQLVDNERYISAEQLLEKNIGQTSAEPELSYLLVKSYLEQDKLNEASAYVNKYLPPANNNDADPMVRVAAAKVLLNGGNKAGADHIFHSILEDKKNQKNPSLLVAMAEVAIEEEKGDARQALQWLEMAEKRDRKAAAIHIARGQAYRKLGDASNSYKSFQEAISNDPGNVRAYYLLGKIFTAQKNPEVYMQHFNKAYQLDSTYAPVLEELYKHYYFRDVRLAKTYLEKYIAHTDHTIQNDYDLADIYFLNADYSSAISMANNILAKEKEKTKPRLYKLIAYSYVKSGDSTRAMDNMKQYFKNEDPTKNIAADFELMAQLTERDTAQQKAAIDYYIKAVELDTVASKKAIYAAAIADKYKKLDDASNQALWLGKQYSWKERTNNVDLFNWGLAHYRAKEYTQTDSVFTLYTERYPEDIYGYYWRAQASAAIDTSMTDSLAIPHYLKVVEIGEKDSAKHKKMLLKAYGYLGGFEANITKDYAKSLEWFTKYDAMEDNADVNRYIEMLQKWIAEKN